MLVSINKNVFLNQTDASKKIKKSLKYTISVTKNVSVDLFRANIDSLIFELLKYVRFHSSK
jgi:hypothetical protein